MMQVNHCEKLAQIAKNYDLSTRALAITCGIAQRTLDAQMRGDRSVSLETLVAISKTFPEISRDWLFMGEGEMIKTTDKETARINSLLDTVQTLQEVINTKNETIATLTERIKQLEPQNNH